MALYRYEALGANGKRSKGTIDAGTPPEARARLRSQGTYICGLEPVIKPQSADPDLNEKEPVPRSTGLGLWQGHKIGILADFSRHLAMLLKAGLPLAQALGVLSDQMADHKFKEVLKDIAVRVKEGASLDEALAVHPQYFPELYICVAQAGALSGDLAQILKRTAQYYIRQKKLYDKLITAISYPILMVMAGMIFVFILVTFVVPRVTAVLLENNQALPWPTEVLMLTSEFCQNWYGAILFSLALFIWIFTVVARTNKGRWAIDRTMLSVPVLGDLISKQAVARMADTMGNLLASGIPVDQSLSVVSGTVGNRVLESEIKALHGAVLEGKELSEALTECTYIPSSVGFVVGVGEESGDLAQVLIDLAQGYHEEVNTVSDRLAGLLSPILLMGLGLAVGFIVAAILLPIVDMVQFN